MLSQLSQGIGHVARDVMNEDATLGFPSWSQIDAIVNEHDTRPAFVVLALGPTGSDRAGPSVVVVVQLLLLLLMYRWRAAATGRRAATKRLFIIIFIDGMVHAKAARLVDVLKFCRCSSRNST